MQLTRPLSAQIELTYACNLSCGHCYNEPRFADQEGVIQIRSVKRKQAPKARYQAIAKTLADAGIFQITLTGGEVLVIRDRLYATLDELAGHDIALAINSNLTNLTEADVRKFKEANLKGILTSIASHDATTHDRLMGRKKAFQETIKGLELLVENDIGVATNMVVSQVNKDHVYQTAKLAHNLGAKVFTLAHMVPAQSAQHLHTDMALKQEEIKATLEQAYEAQKLGLHIKVQIPLPYCTVEEPHLRALLQTSGCAAGRTTIQIHPNGDIAPCPSVQTSYGNILEEDVEDIWQRMHPWRDETYTPKTCAPCDYKTDCAGACRAQADRMSGALDAKHPYATKPITQNQDQTTANNPAYIKREEGIRAREEFAGTYTFASPFGEYMQTNQAGAEIISSIPTTKVALPKQLRTSPVIGIALKRGILREEVA